MFRGMAFVKYRDADQGMKVFELMNGMDINGRKLRIEYKRRVKEADLSTLLGHEGGTSTAATAAADGNGAGSDSDKVLYDMLQSFNTSSSLNELCFPCSSSYQRKQLHHLAEKFGLGHYSTGDGDSKFVLVKKKDKSDSEMSTSLGTSPSSSSGQPIKGRRRGNTSEKPPSLQRQSFSSGSHGAIGSSAGGNGSASAASGGGGGGGGFHEVLVSERGGSSPTNNEGTSHNKHAHSATSTLNNGGGGGTAAVGIATSAPISMDTSRTSSSYGNKSTSRSFGSDRHIIKSPPSSALGTSPTFKKSAAILNRPETGPTIQVIRQPKGPDGTNGFGADYRKQRSSVAVAGVV